MLTFKTLASGSTGNAYVVSDGNTQLLLEAGITFKKVQELMNFETSKLAAVLITHEHGDHVKGLKTFLDRGTNVYMTKGTKEALNLTHHRVKTATLDETRSTNEAKVYKPFKVGTFTILPFEVSHDVNEPVGFLIQSDNGKKMVFFTDTYYCKFNFSGVHLYCVECNYDALTIEENVASGKLHPAQRKRVLKSHMSLENLTNFFKVSDLSKCEEIFLLHLSDRNANRERIFNEVAKVTGKQITIVG
ncbi:MBL fold metallo-hydrolase [Solibacillus isronensis]|uniref:MBL fold metallo-hydrolase n=1 Tax=Solibacillus isronensis TaxID=412383 RepID=UPI0039A264C8